MKLILSKATGILLLFSAVFGILISVTGCVFIWRAKPQIAERINAATELLDRTLTTTDDALTLMDTSLKQSAEGMNKLEGVTQDAALALKDTAPVLNSVADLFGNDFTKIVTDTQASLKSTEASAQFIDDTLSLVSGVSSFIPFQSSPSVPKSSLKASVVQLSQNLVPLPGMLKGVQTNLKSTSSNLQRMQKNIDDMVDNIHGIKGSLDQSQKIITEYKSITTELKSGLSDMQTQLLSWLNIAIWGITLVLVWMITVQISMFLQGLESIVRKIQQ